MRACRRHRRRRGFSGLRVEGVDGVDGRRGRGLVDTGSWYDPLSCCLSFILGRAELATVDLYALKGGRV
jgi:hypothetical protein